MQGCRIQILFQVSSDTVSCKSSFGLSNSKIMQCYASVIQLLYAKCETVQVHNRSRVTVLQNDEGIV